MPEVGKTFGIGATKIGNFESFRSDFF